MRLAVVVMIVVISHGAPCDNRSRKIASGRL
jgi:hypothetical protein